MQFFKTILAIAAIVSVTSAAVVSRSCKKQSACNVEGEIKCGKQTFTLTSRKTLTRLAGKYYKADAVYRCKNKCWVMDPLCSPHEGCKC
jgi:hypothetical protein